MWENTPSTRYFGEGMEYGQSRRSLFYNLPAPFVNLVGREQFIEWRHNRSAYERDNESIAISFIRYFDISKEDFTKANEETRQIWALQGFYNEEFRDRSFERILSQGLLIPDKSFLLEVFDVELVFTFDNERINEFLFLIEEGGQEQRDKGEVGVEVEEIRIRADQTFIPIPADDQQPVLIEGCTLVPLRAVMENLGFTVDWQEAEGLVTLTMGANHTIQVQIDNLTMQVNGISVALDVPPQLINGRTMVPVRAIAEATGFTVDWRWQDRIVDITF